MYLGPRAIYVNKDSPNLGSPYLKILGEAQCKKTPCIMNSFGSFWLFIAVTNDRWVWKYFPTHVPSDMEPVVWGRLGYLEQGHLWEPENLKRKNIGRFGNSVQFQCQSPPHQYRSPNWRKTKKEDSFVEEMRFDKVTILDRVPA